MKLGTGGAGFRFPRLVAHVGCCGCGPIGPAWPVEALMPNQLCVCVCWCLGCVLVFGGAQLAVRPMGQAGRVLHCSVVLFCFVCGWRQGSATCAQVLCLMHPNQPAPKAGWWLAGNAVHIRVGYGTGNHVPLVIVLDRGMCPPTCAIAPMPHWEQNC